MQRMDEQHVYSEPGKHGDKWVRVFVNPQMSVDAKIDPFSQKDFTEKTGRKRGGTIGDLMDTSKEMSAKRERILGKDPIKEKLIDDYERRTHKKHPSKIPKSLEIDLCKKQVTPTFSE